MHPHMTLSIEECVDYTHLKEKITVIYPTCQAPIECLLWSTFSLLLRAKPDSLIEHFMVAINGPDLRTGSTANQDQKQDFLEELRRLQWWHINKPTIRRDMPITVLRVWSRIGHSESIEMALPWVHTDAFLIMHDDIIINKHDWLLEVKDKFYSDPDVIIAYTPELHCCQCESGVFNNKPLLKLPHLSSVFLVCKKKWIRKIGSSWCGYHVEPKPFKLNEVEHEEFFKYYKNLGLLDKPPQTDAPYHYVSMDIGAWQYYNAVQQGLKFVPLDTNLITHIAAASWKNVSDRIQEIMPTIKLLEKEIYAHPDYRLLYSKYLPEKYK